MKKNRIITCLFLAIAMAFVNPICANAQFGNLLKKAKKAIKIESSSEDGEESSKSSKKGLNPEVFIYQPVDDPVNAPLYDINNPKVKEYYEKIIIKS